MTVFVTFRLSHCLSTFCHHTNSKVQIGVFIFIFISLFILIYTVEARIRANTQNVKQGEQETVGNRHTRRSVEGSWMGRGTRGKQDGHYRDFQEGKQGI